MVERPIKKSELAARAAEGGERDRPQGGERRERSGGRGRKGGRGKGRGDREERKPAVPLALMRGPKPQPKVEEPEPVEEAVAEEAAEASEATEATEGDTEAAEATPDATPAE